MEGGRIVVVEDGSLLDPVQTSDIADAGLTGEVVRLARNVGHQRAIATGLSYIARTHPEASVVVMDADGEDTPDVIPELLAALHRDGKDAVVAERRRRSESVGFKAFYLLYRLFFQAVTGHVIRFGNFSALSPVAVRRLVLMPELWLHLASCLIVSRMRIASVPADRGVRYFGRSHMSFVSLALHGMRSMMVFAEAIMVRVGILCGVLAAAAGSLLAISAGLKLADIATPGWYSTASGILVVIVLQAGMLAFLMLMVMGASLRGPPAVAVPLDLLIMRVDRVDADPAVDLTGTDGRPAALSAGKGR